MKIYAVDGIGNIHMTHKDCVMRETVNKPAVTFFTISGAKNVNSEAHTGQVVKISSDERYAVMESNSPVEAMQNIVVDIGGKLYAKVTSVEGKDITICFTSKPDNFSDWTKSLF